MVKEIWSIALAMTYQPIDILTNYLNWLKLLPLKILVSPLIFSRKIEQKYLMEEKNKNKKKIQNGFLSSTALAALEKNLVSVIFQNTNAQ